LKAIEGYEAMHMIRKGQVRWLANGDEVGQRAYPLPVWYFRLKLWQQIT
jgi:hypothetical protein